MILRLLLAALLLSLGCANAQQSTQVQQATPAPALARIKTDQYSTGANFYSDAEFTAMELRVVNLDDMEKYPSPAVKLAPQTRISLLEARTLKVHGGSTVIPIPFDRVRVLDGPANNREGWIPTVMIE